MIELKEKKERVILVGVSTSDQDDTLKSLEELAELAATAGAETAGMVVQNENRCIRGLTWEKER